MIAVVPYRDEPVIQPQLRAIFHDRKQLFVDLIQWDAPTMGGFYQKDQFDTPDATFLAALDPVDERHLGSVRLIPTTRPHRLRDLLGNLCDTPAPAGSDVWEVSRLCAARGLSRCGRRDIARKLMIALVKFGLLRGISNYLCVVPAGLLPQLLAMGWDVAPLGLPRRLTDGQVVGAHSLSVRAATLDLFRMQWPQARPNLIFSSPSPLSA